MRRPVQFGKYLLLGRISVGGMAEVFKAKSFGVQGFQKIIAIKRILPSLGRDEDFITMFIDEAKIAGQLAHANIGQIHELGQVDGAHFIAMEYIWGRDLLQLQNRFKKRGKRISMSAASFIVMKVCEGLHYAHKKRDVLGTPMDIVHRDCSPQNIVISFEGEVKLIDFGIARAASRSSRTNAGVLKGKFGYMSPEQVRGLPLDRRSDIFSLGIILFEVLTGRRLFDGESDFSTLEKVRNVEVDERLLDEAGVPPALKSVVLRALARTPEARYQWCSEMRDDLRLYMQSIEDAYSYRSLGEEMRAVFSDELVREQELMDIYAQIGPEGLPAEDESVERLVSLDDVDLADSSDESVLDALDFIETSPPPLRRASSGGVDGFEDNPTEIFGEIEMGELMSQIPAAIPPAKSSSPKEIEVPETVDVAELFNDNKFDRGLSQPLVSADDGAKIVVADTSRANVPSASALVASLPKLEGRRPSGTAQVHRASVQGTVRGAAASSSGLHPIPPQPPHRTGEVPPLGTGVTVAPTMGTGVRPRPGGLGRRNALVGVSIAVVIALLLLAVRGIFFAGDGGPDANAPRATLVVLVGDKESADVFLGKDKVGVVPPGDALTVDALKPGTYDIRVERDGAAACNETISVSAEKAKVYSCDFSAARQGTLLIEDLRSGDHVVIDGKAVPQEALAKPLLLVAGRSHLVAVTRNGKLVDEFEVTVQPNKETRHAVPVPVVATDAGVAEIDMKPDIVKPGDDDAKTHDAKTSVGKAKSSALLDDEPSERTSKTKPPEDTTKDPAEAAPEPKATGPGYLVPWTRPWARVHIDGKDTGKVTPVAPSAKIPLSPGSHKVTFVVGSKKHNFTVEIESGKTTKLSKILEP